MTERSAVGLLQRLRALGVHVSREGDALRLSSGGHALEPAMLAEVKARKSELLAFLRAHDKERRYEPIRSCAPASHYELSHAQRRLWIRQQFENERAVYNIPAAFHIRGPLVVDALERAIAAIIGRHESLRTSFDAVDGRPVTRVRTAVDFHLAVIDIREREDAEDFVRQYAERDARLLFDLTSPPLLRAVLLQTRGRRPSHEQAERDEHVLIVNMHHIVSDGWSVLVLLDELQTLYRTFLQGQPDPLPPPTLQYKDYAAWQHQMLATSDLERDRQYWRHKLAAPLPRLLLPTDRPRPAARTFHGDTLVRFLDEPATLELEAFGRRAQATPFMVLTALVEWLLYRYTGQREVVLGTPIAGRTHPDLANQIGFYVNMLVLRNQVDPTASFETLVSAVKDTALEAYQHQNFPFDRLVDELDVERDVSRSALFDVAVALQNEGDMSLRLQDLEVVPLENTYKISKYDLVFTFARLPQGLRVAIEYSADLFDAPRIERMWTHFAELASRATKHSRAIRDLDILTEGEQRQLAEWNRTAATYPTHETLVGLFERQVARHPDRDAIACGDERHSYRALNALANRVAHRLREAGTQGERVAIVVEPSAWTIAAMLGVLKVGGAYVPLDPTWPRERLAYVLRDSGCRHVVLENHLRDRLPADAGLSLIGPADVQEAPDANLDGIATPDDVAYVIYTSGSTGTPKGCLVSHRNVVRLMRNDAFPFEFSERDVWMLAHSLCFDFSVWEMYGALLYGGLLVAPKRAEVRDAARFLELIKTWRVSVLNQTPAAFGNLTHEALRDRHHRLDDHLRYVIFGGAKLELAALRPWADRYPLDGIRLVNMYGITETTVHVTVRFLEHADVFSPTTYSPMGRPLPETTVHLLDADMNVVPVGVTGEMYVGGSGVCQGYLSRPELTRERFVIDPHGAGERLYRSGDLARRRADGELEFLGRADAQVKIRGYRIEPGEIEHGLLTHPSVAHAHVTASAVGEGEPALVAYVVWRGMAPPTFVRDLREHLSHRVPSYMVPAFFVALDVLPLTSSGKVDPHALPPPEVRGGGSGLGAAPSGAEEAMLKTWQRVLGVMDLGLTDNFFELGGDSIKAVQIAASLHREHLRIRIEDLFEHPTVADAARCVQRLETIEEEVRVAGGAPFTPIQSWFFDHVGIDQQHWNQAVMLRARDRLDESATRVALTALVTHHDALRMVFEDDRQINLDAAAGIFPLTVLDVAPGAIPEAASRVQAACDLARGPLARAALFRCHDADHLLLVVHHLVVDGVSWRILLEDFGTAYDQALRGEAPRFPAKTHSFRRWASRVREYAESPALLAELPYWIRIVSAETERLPPPTDPSLRVGDLRSVSFELDQARTSSLLRRSHRAYGTDVNDLLLCALTLSLRRHLGVTRTRVALEGHGREEILEGLNVSRTVGWFTTVYPVLLDASIPAGSTSVADDNVSQAIRSVKETLRRVPRKGIGYGILRYLTPPALRMDARLDAEPDICFNYLGQFSPTEATPLTPSAHGTGDSVSPRGEILYALEVTGLVLDERLRMTLRYRPDALDARAACGLADDYEAMLIRVIEHCAQQEERHLTPSDVGDASLTLAELDDITVALGAGSSGN